MWQIHNPDSLSALLFGDVKQVIVEMDIIKSLRSPQLSRVDKSQ